jgi:ABC-type branched-subunit amino acid transport system substrate-binding protein
MNNFFALITKNICVSLSLLALIVLVSDSIVTAQPLDQSNMVIVTTPTDYVDPNDGVVTLREAMIIAHTGGVTENDEQIDANEKVFIDLSNIRGTILLYSPLPRIDKDIEIFGDSSLNLTINGNDQHRIFFVYKGTLTLSNVILRKGRAQGGKGGNQYQFPGGGGGGMGGALFVNQYGKALCSNVHFVENTAKGGNAGKRDDYYFGSYGAGGGFFGDAESGNGGSGGYLGDEGKGGDYTTTAGSQHGGFGGGGGQYKTIKNNRSYEYGGNGGFGGGGSAGNYYSGKSGGFGGDSSWSEYHHSLAGGGAGLGGAIFVREYGEFEASNCMFNNNHAEGGSGAYYSSLLEGIPGQGKGGALFVHNTNATAYLKDCSFSGNEAQDASGNFVSNYEHQDNNDFYGANFPVIPCVTSILLDQYPPVSSTEISYVVEFDVDVTGVDVTDFGFETDDENDTHVTVVEAIDSHTYRVTVQHTRPRGFVTLKLIDDDSIRDIERNYPLGFTGEGNGDFIGETCYFHPTVVIESVLPITGDLKDYGDKILHGIELGVATNYIVNSATPQAIWKFNSRDNQGDTSMAEALVADANTNNDVIAIFGGAVSDNTIPMAELCQSHQIPLFSPTSTSTLLTDIDFTIKPIPLDNYQIDAIYYILEEYVYSNHSGGFAIIAEDSDYGKGFLELADKNPGKYEGSYLFPSNSLDTEDAFEFLKEMYTINGIYAVVLAVYEDDAIALLERLESNEDGILTNLTYIFTDSATTDKTIDNRYLPSNLAFYGITPIVPNTLPVQSFANEYRTAYGSDPEWFSYYAYDAVAAFSEAITISNEITRQGIWNAIQWLRFDGLTGTKTFDEKGNLYSAAYDLHYMQSRKWKRMETIHVFKPEENVAQGNAKTVALSQHLNNESVDFTYTLNAADPLISHLGGEQIYETGWMAESLDAPLGGVLMAYYEDIERELSDDDEPFVFEDGRTYYLTFNMLREDQSEDSPTEGDVLEITVKSIYRYQNGDGITHFSRQELLNETVDLIDWPSDSSKQVTIPITYASAAPSGVSIDNEGNRFHWELKLLNAAKQRVVLGSVEIGTNVPTAVEDYMLY